MVALDRQGIVAPNFGIRWVMAGWQPIASIDTVTPPQVDQLQQLLVIHNPMIQNHQTWQDQSLSPLTSKTVAG